MMEAIVFTDDPRDTGSGSGRTARFRPLIRERSPCCVIEEDIS
jgi:hypothetical protein